MNPAHIKEEDSPEQDWFLSQTEDGERSPELESEGPELESETGPGGGPSNEGVPEIICIKEEDSEPENGVEPSRTLLRSLQDRPAPNAPQRPKTLTPRERKPQTREREGMEFCHVQQTQFREGCAPAVSLPKAEKNVEPVYCGFLPQVCHSSLKAVLPGNDDADARGPVAVKIFIGNNGKVVEMQVKGSDTVLRVKELLQLEQGGPLGPDISLACAGKPLLDTQKMCDLRTGGPVQLVTFYRCRGGGSSIPNNLINYNSTSPSYSVLY